MPLKKGRLSIRNKDSRYTAGKVRSAKENRVKQWAYKAFLYALFCEIGRNRLSRLDKWAGCDKL